MRPLEFGMCRFPGHLISWNPESPLSPLSIRCGPLRAPSPPPGYPSAARPSSSALPARRLLVGSPGQFLSALEAQGNLPFTHMANGGAVLTHVRAIVRRRPIGAAGATLAGTGGRRGRQFGVAARDRALTQAAATSSEASF